MMNTTRVLKNNLRVLRAQQNISQQTLAAGVGVSRQTINSIENEKYEPSCNLALRIVDYFQVACAEVFWLE